jgi:hypothetical protein
VPGRVKTLACLKPLGACLDGVRFAAAGTKLTLLSRSRATSRAPYRQYLFLGYLHRFMVWVFLPEGWSILTSALFSSYILNVSGTRWDSIVQDKR